MISSRLYPLLHRRLARFSNYSQTIKRTTTKMSDKSGHSMEAEFDFSLGTAIAGYAFEAYSTPTKEQQDKTVFTSDGTKVILTSQKFTELVFSGVLAVTLESTSLQSGESQANANIGFDLSIEEEASVKMGPGAGFISRTKSARKGETLYLFLKDVSASSVATLRCTAAYTGYVGAFLGLVTWQSPMTGTIPLQKLLAAGFGKKATDITMTLHTVGSEHKAGTLKASYQLFPLRKNGATDPKIIEMFPEVLENSTTLTPWMEVVRGVLTSEKEDKGHGHAEEKYHDNNEETEHDHNHKSGDKHYRIVSGVLNTPSRCLDLICCVDNERTGTQASIWAHSTHKQIVISFRGTQPGERKDVFADLKFAPEPYLNSHTDLNFLVHYGFKDCSSSVREALLQILHLLLTAPDDEDAQQDHWDIVVTGHSLGGAISSLFSFELARMRNGLWGDSNDAAKVYNDDSERFLTALKAAGLTNYSYGCPRVGNEEFRTKFGQLLPNSIRIINSKDLIPRMPLAGFGWHGPTTYVGVGRQYRIDMKGGGKDDGYLGYIENVPIMIFNALTFQNVGAHLTDAYQASFTVASEVIIEAAHIKKVAIAKLTGST